jgi:hypothetical protein
LRLGVTGHWNEMVIGDSRLDTLAEACVYYNRCKSYDFWDCNCQTFVLNATKNMGIELKFEGEMKRVIDELKSKGTITFSYRNNNFETRRALDKFVMTLDCFENLPKCDKSLLFSYKNVFDEYLKREPYNSNYMTDVEAEEHWNRLLKENFENNQKDNKKYSEKSKMA